MHLFGLRRIFRALHGVKYSTCEVCGEAIPGKSTLHTCDLKQVPLSFFYTKLTECSRSVHFKDRAQGHGFLHEIKIWMSRYVNGIELNIEDPSTKKFIQVRRGETSGNFFRMRLLSGEFITKVEFGCDFQGIYYLGFVSNKQEMLVGELDRPARMFQFPEGFGLVGIFGAFTEKILHLGFYFDSTCLVNWSRRRGFTCEE
jgi:hypothetical protein